jgi:uncharacterized protein YllA (UPF0747 family)
VVVTGRSWIVWWALFSVFKALTAVKLAETATQTGVDTVPVFWWLRKINDLDEIQSIFLPEQKPLCNS